MDPIDKFLDAWLISDAKKMKAILKKEFQNTANQKVFETIIELEPRVSNLTRKKELFPIIMQAIELNQKNVTFFTVLIYLGFILADNLGDKAEFNRLYQFIENIDISKIKKGFTGLIYNANSIKNINEFESTSQVKWLLKAEKEFPVGCYQWYVSKCRRIFSSIIYREPMETEKEINIIKKYPKFKHRFFAPEYLLVRHFEIIGDPYKALFLLRNLIKTSEKEHPYNEVYILLEPNLLWQMGNTTEGDLAFNNYLKAKPDYRLLLEYKIKLAERARAMNDPQGIKKNIKEVLLGPKRSIFSQFWANYLLLCSELLEGERAPARRLLETLDPKNSKFNLFPEWVRLYLQEGNIEKAAYYFNCLIEKDKTYINEFSLAFDVKYPQMLQLQNYIKSSEFHKIKNDIEMEQKSSPDVINLFQSFVGNSKSINKIKQNIQTMANQETTVLITGETGTGKEEAAKLLHQLSNRSNEPFLPVNCGGVSDTLIEAELFGYKKGAFTGAFQDHIGLFEAAGKGTIFLDEISSMPLSLQASLLRVLENMQIRPVGSTKFISIEARVIAATNIEMEKLIEEKKFRLDLFYRLNKLQINLPTLKERAEDIPLLISHFLSNYTGGSNIKIDDELMNLLCQHSWPGNVRELKNEVERMIIFAGTNKILTNDLVQFKPTKTNLGYQESSHAISVEKQIPSQTRTNHDLLNKDPKNYKEIRDQKLLQLFKENKILTRAMVIRFMGCAANTAAKDLNQLEADGIIKKVIPTASNRSSYYQFLD